MRSAKCLAVLVWLVCLLPYSSFAQGSGPIPFSSAAPLKVPFPVAGSIVLFFNSSRCETCNQNLDVYAIAPKDDAYERVYIGSVDTDGDPPKVESVFVEDLGGNIGSALFVLVSWASDHPVSGIYAKNYAIYAFGRERDGSRGLKRLSDIEGKIGQTVEGVVEGDDGRPEEVAAKYKSADDVRKILKSLGYQVPVVFAP